MPYYLYKLRQLITILTIAEGKGSLMQQISYFAPKITNAIVLIKF